MTTLHLDASGLDGTPDEYAVRELARLAGVDPSRMQRDSIELVSLAGRDGWLLRFKLVTRLDSAGVDPILDVVLGRALPPSETPPSGASR